MPNIDALARSVDRAALTPVVRRAVGNDAAEVLDWEQTSLPYVNARREDRALRRFAGSARVAGESVPWSLVLKLFRPSAQSSDDPSHPGYWKREVDAVRCGLLDDLPGGLVAPRCYGITGSSDGTVWLWLEEVADVFERDWPLERYGLAARHLGQFNGAYVAGRPLPSYEWLTPTGAGGGDAGQGAAIEERLRSYDTWRHPDVRRAFPLSIVDRALRQREDRRAFRAAAMQLPRVLCHNDAGGQNLFARRREDGSEETVAIDWELIGIRPVTTDLAFLVVQTLRRFDVEMEDASRLEEAALNGYIEGLREAGWGGDDGLVRLGYFAAVALRLGLVPSVLSFILDPGQRQRVEEVWNRPLEEVVERWAALAYFVLDRADTARVLLSEP